MSFSIPLIRDALKARIDTIDSLETYDTMPTEVAVPAAIVYPSPGTFLTYQTMDGAADLEFVVIVLVSAGVDDLAQDELDGYLAEVGADSVKAAIDADPRLGNTVDYASVGSAQNYGLHEFGAVQYFGCEFVVSVGVS